MYCAARFVIYVACVCIFSVFMYVCMCEFYVGAKMLHACTVRRLMFNCVVAVGANVCVCMCV